MEHVVCHFLVDRERNHRRRDDMIECVYLDCNTHLVTFVNQRFVDGTNSYCFQLY